MPAVLEPVHEGLPPLSIVGSTGPFAVLDRSCLTALVSAMPDGQSAVLLCLAWDALRQERLAHGPCAGHRLARISIPDLANMTGRPVRSVEWALSKLKSNGLIERVGVEEGKTAVYRIVALNQEAP